MGRAGGHRSFWLFLPEANQLTQAISTFRGPTNRATWLTGPLLTLAAQQTELTAPRFLSPGNRLQNGLGPSASSHGHWLRTGSS